MEHDDVPEILERLERWRQSHQGRHVLFRLAWVLAGFAVLLTGIAMTVLPGPAVVVIPLGLAMLSLEFVWAERLLHTSVRTGLRVPRAALLAAGAAAAAVGVLLFFLL